VSLTAAERKHGKETNSMPSRPTLLLDLARIMIKQAKLLKAQGLLAEARGIARRAIELNHIGHASLRTQPVRVSGNRMRQY
jgi:hypothetical protein